ncbi:hypothetical protein MMC13_007533 [Lambiella insularis]|nr:hypothetical protein [Lambiella insularis]
MAEDADLSRSQRPLAAVVMCCTSIPPEQRSDLALVAAQMGAIHHLDLTSDVTHLIVGAVDTPKYKYVAKERPDVKCLLPEWVDAVRQSWMGGGETDVEALELQFRLPTFFGLRVCVTGFDDLLVRKKLEDAVKRNGGQYKGDLNKQVTHLIAYKPTGKKYSAAKEWGIKTVSIEWLQQSHERGMVLDENLYDPLLAPADRGRDAWVRCAVTESSTKRRREDEHVPGPARKLRRTASARFSNESAVIWTDIAKGVSGPNESKQDEWNEHGNEASASKAGDADPNTAKASESDKVVVNHASENDLVTNALEDGGLRQLSASQALFSGKRFFLHGFDPHEAKVLEHHLLSHNAEILPELCDFARGAASISEDSAFLLVPHTSSERDIPSSPDPIYQPAVVTDMWIELCLYKKRYLRPQANITSSPFRYPVPGFEIMVICSTAFEGIDLLQATKVIKLMGASYEEYLTDKVSVLVCNNFSLNRDKIRHAIHWGVPAVKAEWLWDCLRSGRRKSFDMYLIHPGKQMRNNQKEDKKPGGSNSTMNISQSSGFRTTGSKHAENEDASEMARQPQRAEAEIVQRHEDTGFQILEADSATDPLHAYNAESSETLNVIDESFGNPVSATAGSYPSQAASLPLQELSPNSPPKPHHPPEKATTDVVSDQTESQHDSLTTAISSLLTHHQRDKPRPPQRKATEPARVGRRKRQLLGRAPSNLSACSNNPSLSLSRASSVDTMNTDGLGTPLDTAQSTTSKAEANATLDAFLFADFDEDEHEKEKEKLQMTQLGYEDPEAGVWRERLMSRMSGGKGGTNGNVATPKAKGIGTVRDSMEIGLQSVSRRTRHAGMR